MADNIATAMVNAMLTTLTTSPANTFVQLHTNSPGAAGTSNVASVTTRPAVTWASPSAGSVSANGTLPSWPSWAGTSPQTITDLSFWTSGTPGAGTFDMSMQLSASVAMSTGDTLTLTGITVTIPVAS